MRDGQSEADAARAAIARLEMGGLRRAHVPLLLLCVVALAFDLGEIALGSALSAIFSSGPEASPASAVALLLASVYMGGALGAWPIGQIADRFGRRKAIVLMLLIIAGGSSLAALSQSIATLTVVRGLAGIALGVLPTVLIAYLTEFLPERRRANRIMTLSALGFFGGPLLMLLISALQGQSPLGLEGWRWSLLAGGGGSLVCAGLFMFLPEPPRWLLDKGRFLEAAAVAERYLASPPLAMQVHRNASEPPAQLPSSRIPPLAPWKPRAILVWTVCALTPIVTIAFPVLSGAIMVERGFSLSDSILYVGLSSYGYIFGALATAPLLDHVERKHALVMLAGAMIAGLLCLALFDAALIVIAGCGLFFAAAASNAILLNIYAAELFAVERRACMTCIAWGILRASAVISILWLTPLLRSSGSEAVLSLMIGVLLVSATLVILFGPTSASGDPGASKANEKGVLLS